MMVQRGLLSKSLPTWMKASSYRTVTDDNGELVWITEIDGREVRYHNETESTFGQRFMSGFIMLLPIEHQL